jgi:transcriptional regulator with XRE-family HTH domain
MNKIGERIKIIRKINKLNQEKFSELIGLSQSFLSNAEKDRYNLTIEHIIRITNLFGVNAHWLLIGEGEMFDNTIYGSSQQVINKNIVVDSFCESVRMLTLIYDKNRNLFETVVKYLKQAVGILDIEEGLKDSDKKQ